MIKYLFLLIFLLSVTANATVLSYEVTGGGLIYHPTVDSEAAKLFPDTLSSDGRLMYRSLLGVGGHAYYENRYESLHVFFGKNSINEPMAGGLYGNGWHWRNLNAGFICGAYMQDDDNFKRYGLHPFSVGAGIVPVVGLEVSPRVRIGEDLWLKLNNILTPVITSHSLSLEWEL